MLERLGQKHGHVNILLVSKLVVSLPATKVHQLVLQKGNLMCGTFQCEWAFKTVTLIFILQNQMLKMNVN